MRSQMHWFCKSLLIHGDTSNQKHDDLVHAQFFYPGAIGDTARTEMEDTENLNVECLNTDKEWSQWHIENPFSFTQTTTAIIKWRKSSKKHETSITTKKYKYTSWWDSDDDDDQPPEIIVTDYTFNRMDICVIPQIGSRAGIPQRWTYNKPGEIQYHTDPSCVPKIYVTTQSIPSIDSLIGSVLSYVYDLDPTQAIATDPFVGDDAALDSAVTLRSQFNRNYIRIPVPFNHNFLCYCFKIPHQIIGQIILRYLGVMQISIDFIPNHVFKPLTIDVVDGMRADEIKALMITTLFMKYPKLHSVPRFVWNYDSNGIDRASKRRRRRHTEIFNLATQKQYTAIFEHIKLDHFGLCNAVGNQSCVVLNMVGYGFKTIYFEDFKSIRFQALVDEFYAFTKQSRDNMDNEIVTIFPNHTSKSNERSNARRVFRPNTRYRDWNEDTRSPVFPDEQSKRFMTFDHEKYKALLDKTLFELNLDINGNLIEMYRVTGPCINVCFASMVGDSRIMDVNFNWSIDVFKMYAAKFGHGKSFSIETLKQQKTIGELCAQFVSGRARRAVVVCRY